MGAGGRCAGRGGRWVGGQQLVKGEPEYLRAWARAPPGLREAWLGPVQSRTSPGGLLPTSPGLAPSSSPQSTAGAKASG